MNSFKWTCGQLFIQFPFTSPPNKVRGLLFLCWISPIWLIESFFCHKIWNTKMAYGKNTCIFRCFFAFLSIPLHCRFLLLIPFYSASFLCFPSAIQKLAKMNTFKCNFFAPKAFPFKFPIWVPSRDSSNSKWTVLSGQLFIQFPFTHPPNKVRGLLFCFAGSHQSDS